MSAASAPAAVGSGLVTLACYALLVAFLVLEGRFRRGAAAKSLDPTPADRGTTQAIGKAFVTAILLVLLAPLLSRLGLGSWGGRTLAWAGIGLMACGIGLRFWANYTLGTAYTRTLKTVPDQAVITNGPYRVIRHPGYAGVLLMWFGAGLALGNWIVLAAMALVLGWAYGRRMIAEEAMLTANLGEAYRAYSAHTWRLVPFVY